MSSILFYAPFNQRSRDTESLMIAFHKQGHSVICLSQQEGFLINDFLRANGVRAYSHIVPGERSGWWYYLRHLFFFIWFCRQHHIDIVYSHLEPANFVTSIGQYFIRARAYLCRHHIDEGLLYQFDKDIYYRITYRLAKQMVVVSDHAKRYMIEHESIPEHKIIHINLAYNFELYPAVDLQNVSEIKNQFSTKVLLLSACRLTAFKRPQLSIQLVKKLVLQGLDVKLILLGKGEMQEELEKLVDELQMHGRVFLPGYVSNVLDFMGAADFFIHPSLLDSSCVAVKEAGLASLPVIVCKGVGDFDDYVVHKTNGFVADRDKFVNEAAEIIMDTYRNKTLLSEVGHNLKKSVLDLFSIDQVIGQYDRLNNLE